MLYGLTVTPVHVAGTLPCFYLHVYNTSFPVYLYCVKCILHPIVHRAYVTWCVTSKQTNDATQN